MWFVSRRQAGTMLPRFYGNAGYDPMTNEGISVLIPFNFAYSIAYKIWFWLKRGSLPKEFNLWFDKGWDAGQKSGYRVGYDKAKNDCAQCRNGTHG